MPETLKFPVGINLQVQGDLEVKGQVPLTPRSRIEQDDAVVYPVDLTTLRVWNAYQTTLPGTAAADDLALTSGAFGTGTPAIQAGDLKAAGATTRYARYQVAIPIEYVSNSTLIMRVSGGMTTTVADATATVDLEIYKWARDGLKSGSDLCATAATTINSLTFADVDFTITQASLSGGDIIDCRIAIAVNDAATGTAVDALVGSIELVCDVKG